MKPKIFVTRQLAEESIQKLKAYFEVSVNPEDKVLSRQELTDAIKDKDGVLCLLNDVMDARLIEAAPKLKVISNYAVGYNNIDLPAANKKKVAVYYTPGVLTDTTADLAWALILAATRRVVEADAFTRSHQFSGWDPKLFLGFDVHHKTLGIMGMGRIGLAVAKRAAGFNMKVLYTAQHDKELPDAQFVTLETLLQESDVISVHLPYNDSSHHVLNEAAFAKMKKTAVVINTARGPIIDEQALVRALKNKQIAGAGLDVYEKEPEISPELFTFPQVVLLPHIGSATLETRTQMAMVAVENLIQFFFGQKTENLVNPKVLG